MLPFCYETGLTSGHVSDASYFMSVATETFIKEVLSSVFSKTRSNGPGSAGSAGTGGGAAWIQTYKYRAQLEKEEELSLRGDIQRDKSGLLPIEARAASERGPLGMADVRTALELGDCGLGQMPIVVQQILLGFREGEVETLEVGDYSWHSGHHRNFPVDEDSGGDTKMIGLAGATKTNSHPGGAEGIGWEGVEYEDSSLLNSVLDGCLAN